jgi:hypothetical protein
LRARQGNRWKLRDSLSNLAVFIRKIQTETVPIPLVLSTPRGQVDMCFNATYAKITKDAKETKSRSSLAPIAIGIHL